MKKPSWWGLIAPSIVVLIVISFIPLAAIYVARNSQSPITRLSIIQDMDNQPRFKAQQHSELFADARSMRRPMDGTVARGTPVNDTHLTQGIVGDEWATTFPPSIEIDAELLGRGQNRFNIYCATCHGYDGSGKGAVDARAVELEQMAWIAPSDYHTDTVRDRPVGHIYNTISNGIRTMPSYAKQLDYYDRWAVVAYVRALQRSRNASLEDAPDEERRYLHSLPPPSPAVEEEEIADVADGDADGDAIDPGGVELAKPRNLEDAGGVD